jgi:SHS2 domain-containing protein
LNGTEFKKDIKLKQEIKSVTYHQVEIVEAEGNYSTLVVFDI